MSGSTKLLTSGGGGLILTPASNIASDVTVNIPSVNGTAVIGNAAVSAVGQIPFSTDGTTFTPTAKIVSGTAVASTSGTSIDFTGIPSWVKRITVMLNGVSTNGSSLLRLQLGSGTIITSGYLGSQIGSTGGQATNGGNLSAGFDIQTYAPAATPAALYSGSVVFTLTTANNWTASGIVGQQGNATIGIIAGYIPLSGTLDRLRLTTVGGTDTFDAGSVNIQYE